MAATTISTPSSTFTMKLLVDSSPLRWRVVFAEAGKDTVDFLFSLLAMPTGGAVKLLGKESTVGCIRNLYSSAEKLDGAYNQRGAAAKDAILCDRMPSPTAAGPNRDLFRLPEPTLAPALAPKRFFSWVPFKCGRSYYRQRCSRYVTKVSSTRCPSCGIQMTCDTNLVGSPAPVAPAKVAAEKGFVQGCPVTYTVTDDLVISPMSNVSSIALLNACSVRDFGTLQERTVQIGYKEGLEILKSSLQSKTVLTDVFLGKNLP